MVATLEPDFITHLWIVLCLFICSVTWVEYFGKVYFPCSVKPVMAHLRGYSLGCVHLYLGWLAGLSLTVFLPDFSLICLIGYYIQLLGSTNCWMISLFTLTMFWCINCLTVLSSWLHAGIFIESSYWEWLVASDLACLSRHETCTLPSSLEQDDQGLSDQG